MSGSISFDIDGSKGSKGTELPGSHLLASAALWALGLGSLALRAGRQRAGRPS